MRSLPLKKILFGYLFSFIFFFIFASNASAQQPTLNFMATSGSTGTVNLSWTMLPYVENYNIAYGPSSGHYLYGVNGIGNVGHYTIGGLTPGQTYYFVLSPVDGEVALPFTPYVAATAAN